MNKKNCINLSSYRVYYKETDSEIRRSIKVIKKAVRYNSAFFKMSLPKFDIILVYSRKEMNRLFGNKTPNYLIAFANRRGIVIFSPGVIEKETIWKKSDFYSTLIHEISHLFFKHIAKKYSPVWLNEGIATYLQNNNKKPKYKTKISYRTLVKKFSKNRPLNYNIGYSMVYFLIKKYKKQKLIILLRNLKKIRNKEKLFSSVYNKKLKELVKDVNKI